MTRQQVSDRLQEAGIRVELVEGRVRFSPSTRMTSELKTLVTEHKDELLSFLAADQDQIDYWGVELPWRLVENLRAIKNHGMWIQVHDHDDMCLVRHSQVPQRLDERKARELFAKIDRDSVWENRTALAGQGRVWLAYPGSREVPA